MKLGICSFSFHRLLADGKQDMFKYIEDCKELGCTQLDPWNAHLAELEKGNDVLHAGHNPGAAKIDAAGDEYIARVKQAADDAGLPFGCIAVDGAYIYDESPEKSAANRQVAYRWLDIAAKLGAPQVRIDAGGPEDMPDEIFAVIKEGYEDLIARGRNMGIQILFENHWGPSKHPANCRKLVEEIDGLGLLFDSNNWAPGEKEEGWQTCAKHASSVHIKTFQYDENGDEPTVDIGRVIGILKETGYDGAWVMESVPKELDEYEGVKKAIALVRKHVEA